MSCGDEGFHFVDLLGLHMGCRLPIPRVDGLLELMHKLTDVHLPLLAMYPPSLVAAACKEIRVQFPWLNQIDPDGGVKGRDWAYLWCWVDKNQRKHAPDDHDGTPVTFHVEPIPAERMPRLPQIVIMRLPEDEA